MNFKNHIQFIKSQIREMTVEEFSQISDGVIIDVREAHEIASGIIPGAVALSRGVLESKIAEFYPNADQTILLYCASGTRSALSAQSLQSMGYCRVYSLAGGIEAWKQAGRDLEFPEQLEMRQQSRYARHISLKAVGEKGQHQLLQSRVLIVGAGGLGSPCALYLAAAGIGTIGIVDDDRVDFSNLQRQVLHGESGVGESKVVSAERRLRDLNSDVTVMPHAVRLTCDNALEILSQYDFIVNGCDNFATRYLLSDACVRLRKPLFDAAIHQFEGQLTVYDVAQGGPCYRCLYREPPPAELAPNCQEAGVLGVLPGVMGTLQASEVLKRVLGLGESLVGRLLIYNSLEQKFRELKIKRDAACPCCGDHPTIQELGEYQAVCQTK